MEPIRRIADLPFREREAFDLLHLDEIRDAPDADYAGYGHGRVDAVWLEGRDGAEPRLVRDALVLALHSCDDGAPLADDIELEFVIDEVADGYSVTALLSTFLEQWLPRVSRDERAIVLVACNPHRAVLSRPAPLATAPIHYALGDVESWLDPDDGGPRIRLVADTWRTME